MFTELTSSRSACGGELGQVLASAFRISTAIELFHWSRCSSSRSATKSTVASTEERKTSRSIFGPSSGFHCFSLGFARSPWIFTEFYCVSGALYWILKITTGITSGFYRVIEFHCVFFGGSPRFISRFTAGQWV